MKRFFSIITAVFVSAVSLAQTDALKAWLQSAEGDLTVQKFAGKKLDKVEAEKAALDRGVGSQYPAAAGVPELKAEASRFIKAFMNVDVSARSCVPTVGSVAGSYGSFIACTQRIPGKNKVLFIDPGFPIQKSQLRVIGAEWVEFDIYESRRRSSTSRADRASRATRSCPIRASASAPSSICRTIFR